MAGPLPALRTSNMVPPKDNKSTVVPWQPDFSDGASDTRDFLEELQSGDISFVQSVYIDNSGNANDAYVLEFETGTPVPYRISCPAGSQGWFPVTVPPNVCKVTATCTLNATGAVLLANVPMPYFVYPSATVAQVTANVAPTQGAFTDRSVVLTGGADNVMNANAGRKAFFLQLDPAAIGPVTIGFTGGPSLILTPGQIFNSDGFVVNTQAVTAQGPAGATLNAGEL